jgi:hypothetical protein
VLAGADDERADAIATALSSIAERIDGGHETTAPNKSAPAADDGPVSQRPPKRGKRAADSRAGEPSGPIPATGDGHGDGGRPAASKTPRAKPGNGERRRRRART